MVRHPSGNIHSWFFINGCSGRINKQMVMDKENVTITKVPVFGSASRTHEKISFWRNNRKMENEKAEAKSVELNPKLKGK